MAKGSFALMMAAEFRRAGQALEIGYDAEKFRLTFGGDENHWASLTNIYRGYQGTPPHRRREVVGVFVRAWIDGMKDLPEEFGDAAHDLLPIVRNRSDFALEALRARTRSGNSSGQVHRIIADHFGVGPVYDLPNSMRHLDARRLSDWGVGLGEAMDVALANLRKITREGLERLPGGLWRSLYRDEYDASRILLPEFIERCEVVGDPVVLIPNGNTLLVAGSGDEVGLARLAEEGLEAFRQPRPLSLIPLRLRAGTWEPFSPPPDHPLYPLFRSFRARTLYQDYVNQADLLRELHAKDGLEVFVASVLMPRNPEAGGVVSCCVWTEGVDTLLPRTDVVALVRPTCPEIPIIGGWARVCEVVGDLMEPVGLYPERYRVRAFPSDEQLRAIASAC